MIATAAVTVTATGVMLVTALPVAAQPMQRTELPVVERAAEILNVSDEQLTDAFKQAQIEAIENKIQNDEIDAEHGIDLIQKIDEADGLPFFAGERRSMRLGAVREYREDVLDFLRIDHDEFRAYLQDGDSLLDIAADKNIREDDLRMYVTALHIESIESNENLTEDQKELRLARVDEIVDKILNFSPPAPRGEGFGFGPRGLAL